MPVKLFQSVALVTLTFLSQTDGHGFMYIPSTWNHLTDTYPELGPKQGDPGLIGSATDWWTNHTFNSNPTLPSEFYDQENVKWRKYSHPWGSPGSAPVWGEGCGANGGNPNGCSYDGEPDPNPYGTCCPGYDDKFKNHCGGYNGGRSAMEHAAEGLFDNAIETTWSRGENTEVFWSSGGRHRGGYAYRLCKVPAGGISKVTEQCFQDGHLNFAGTSAWIYKHPTETLDPNNWIEFEARRLTEGTNPPGSEWTVITLPTKRKKGDFYSFKDLVTVPEDLEPGQYVLSFRWDCEHTAQVWSSCANINVV